MKKYFLGVILGIISFLLAVVLTPILVLVFIVYVTRTGYAIGINDDNNVNKNLIFNDDE